MKKEDVPSVELDADLKLLFDQKVTNFKAVIIVLMMQMIRELKAVKAKIK